MANDVSIVLSAVDNTRTAVQSVKSGLDSVKQSAAAVSSALSSVGALAVVGLAVSFAGTVKEAIDAADAINKLSQRTGVAAEALSQLQFAAKLSDVSTEDLTTGLKKLSLTMAEALGGNKDKLEVFKNLGINLRDASGAAKSVDTVLLGVADAYSMAADGANKLAYSNEIGGKSFEKLIPLLNGGKAAIVETMEKANKLGLTISTKFAQDSEAFKDNLTILDESSKRLAISLGGELVSGLGSIAQKMAEAAVTGGKLHAVMVGLDELGNKAFNWSMHQERKPVQWLEDEIETLKTVKEQIKFNLFGSSDRLAAEIAAKTAELQTALKGYYRLTDGSTGGGRGTVNPKNAKPQQTGDLPTLRSAATASAGANTFETLRAAIAIEQELADLELANGKKLSEYEKKRVQDIGKVAEALKAGKISEAQAATLSNSAIAASESRRAADTQAATNAYLEGVNEKISANRLELAADADLTEGQKMAAAWTTKLRDGKLDLLDSQKQTITAALEELIGLEKANALKKQQLKLGQDLIAAGQKTVSSLQDEIDKAKEYYDTIGLTTEQIAAITAAKAELSAAADDELAANLVLAASYAGDLHDAYLQYASDLTDVAKKKRELSKIKIDTAAKDASADEFKRVWESVDRTAHDTFVSIFEGGKDTFTRLRDTLKNTLIDLLYQMTVRKWVFNIVANVTGSGSVASAVLGGGGGSGGLVNSASNINSLYSTGKSVYTVGSQYFGGTMSAANAGGTLYANATGGGLDALLSTNAAYGTTATTATTATGTGEVLAAGSSAGPWGLLVAAVILFLASRDATRVASTGHSNTQFDANGNVVDRYNLLYGGDTPIAIPSVVNGVGQSQDLSGLIGPSSTQLVDGTSQAQVDAANATYLSNTSTNFTAISTKADKYLEGLNGTYQAAAKALGATTIATAFAFGANDSSGGKFRLGVHAGSQSFDSGEVALSEPALKLAASQAVLTALKASDLPKYLQGVFDGVDAATLDQAGVDKAINNAIDLKNAYVTLSQVPGADLSNISFETLNSIKGVVNELAAVNTSFYALGFTLFDISAAGGAAAAGLVAAFGGLENFQTAVNGYYDNFYTQEEKKANVSKSIANKLNAAGGNFTEADISSLTREGFRALVDSTDTNSPLFGALLGVSGAFASVTPATDKAADAVSNFSRSMETLGNTKFDLTNQLLTLRGQTGAVATRIRDNDLKKLTAGETDPGKISEITASYDENVGLQKAIDDFRAAQEAQAQYARDAAQAQQDAAAAAQAVRDAWQAVTDSLFDEVTRIRGVTGGGAQSFAQAQAKFTITAAQASAGDQEAAKVLPELSKVLLQLAENNATSIQQLRAIQGQTAGTLESIGNQFVGQFGLKLPKLATGTNYVPQDMLALIHAGKAVVPAAYNPANGGGASGSTNALAAEMKALRNEIAALRATHEEGNVNTKKSADILVRVTENGKAMQTQVAT